MEIKNLKLQNYIRNYNIVNPSWDNLPAGFPHCDTSGLNYDEKIAWGMILLAWKNEHPLAYINLMLGNIAAYSTLTFVLTTILVSVLYYLDVNYQLGLTFLTDFFA